MNKKYLYTKVLQVRPDHGLSISYKFRLNLGPSINRLVTDRNTKLCCQGFFSALFQCTIAYKIGSEHTQDYTKLFVICRVEILQVTAESYSK